MKVTRNFLDNHIGLKREWRLKDKYIWSGKWLAFGVFLVSEHNPLKVPWVVINLVTTEPCTAAQGNVFSGSDLSSTGILLLCMTALQPWHVQNSNSTGSSELELEEDSFMNFTLQPWECEWKISPFTYPPTCQTVTQSTLGSHLPTTRDIGEVGLHIFSHNFCIFHASLVHTLLMQINHDKADSVKIVHTEWFKQGCIYI